MQSLFNIVLQMDPYKEFVKLMLPVEVRESFEFVKVDINTYPSDTKTDELGEMHIYLDEENRTPDNRTDLTPNGFFPAIKINDYPIRGHKVTLHIRRRRWTDPEGHNISTDWDNIVQEHSRLSPDFVTFLKAIRRELSTDSTLLREVLLHQR